MPELWVLGIVRNPAKPEWCLGLSQEFEPTAISFCADWSGGPPDGTWSCSPNSAEVIFIRHFAELRKSSPGATMSVMPDFVNRAVGLRVGPSDLTLAFASQECHTPSPPLLWRQLLRRDFPH